MRWILGLSVIVLAAGGYLLKQYTSVPPEEKVRRTLMEAKAAVEMKQYSRLMRLISPNYRDSTGMTYMDLENAIQSYMKDRDLLAKIDVIAMTVYVRRNTSVADLRLQVTLTVGERNYTFKPSSLTIFLQKELMRWRIITVEGWQRILDELTNYGFVY